MKRLSFDHRISESHKDSDLFESIFEVKLSNNINCRNTSLSKSEVSIRCNYFNINNFKRWNTNKVKSLFERTVLFNLKSINTSAYILDYVDMNNDRNRIYKASFSIGVYDKKLEYELFKSSVMKRIIFNGQNYEISEGDFKMCSRKVIINKILNS